jgi:hypothetical protein
VRLPDVFCWCHDTRKQGFSVFSEVFEEVAEVLKCP